MHAESSRRWLRILTVFISIFALAGCGEGDGPIRVFGEAATPLPPGGGGNGGVATLGVFSDTNSDPIVTIEDFRFAGNQVFIELADDRVFDGAVSLELIFTTGGEEFGGAIILFADADVSAYDTLKFSIDTSSFPNFANLTVQLEPPPGGTGGNVIFLSDYTPVATSGNWQTYEIPLAAFPTVDPTLVNKLGFFNARDGSNALLAGALYLDDIHFTFVGSDSADAGTPIDPEVVLYATDRDPDLVRPGDYEEITDLDSDSVIDELYAEDETYSPVLSVFSGIVEMANVARVGYTGFARGFAGAYETLNFKVKGMPNSVIFVKLFDGVDTLRINLTSSALSEALTNGWYQVSIPISSFNGVSVATGLVFESDDTALMQFRMLLTDIGFSGTAGDGGDGGDCDNGGATDPVAVVFDDDYGAGVSFAPFGDSVNDVTVDPTEAYSGTAALKVVVPADAYTGGALVADPARDVSAYDTLTFWAKASDARTLNVAGIGDDASGDAPNAVEVKDLALTTEWQQFTITIPDPSVLTANTGLFHFAEGSDEGVYTIWFDEITYVSSSGGGDCGEGDDNGGATDPVAVVFDDDYGAGVSFAPFGDSVNDVTVDPTEAYSGTAALKVVVPADAYTGGALVADPARDVSAYDTLTFWAKASDARTLNVAGIGDDASGDAPNAVEVKDLALTTEWQQFTITIPDPSVLTANTGLFHFAEGSDEGVYTIWFDEITYVSSSGGGGPGGGVAGNIVPDGDFENGMLVDPPWKIFANDGLVEISNAQANGGTFSAHLLASVPAGGGPASFPILKVERLEEGNLTGGESVTVSFDAIAVDQQPGPVVFVAQLFTERSGVDTGASDEVLFEPPTFLTDSWTTYSFDTTLGPDAGGGVSLLFKADCGGTAGCVLDAYIDNVSIVIN